MPPCGGHRGPLPDLPRCCGFQVVPPCGGHPPRWALSALPLSFQVVPPCGGHLALFHFLTRKYVVSSRAPVWGASIIISFTGNTTVFQVVPPCGGHRLVPTVCIRREPVSSRAPVWGASHMGWFCFLIVLSFKSCPRVGGIQNRITHRCHHLGFQVVPPCGGHRRCNVDSAHQHLVSSRAPVWGASFYIADFCILHLLFQVVPPCGGHRVKISSWAAKKRFQVVPPCGGHLASTPNLG